MDLVQKKSLYFPSADQLCAMDPFEGAYPARFDEWLDHDEKKRIGEAGAPPPDLDERRRKTCKDVRRNRSRTFVSCWHRNRAESEAFWKLYGDTIAITTLAKRLVTAFSSAHIYDVKYITYSRDGFPVPGTLYPYFHKQTAYSHENEVRAVYDFDDLPAEAQDQARRSPGQGVHFPVDLAGLVTGIYVAPGWSSRLGSIETLARDHGLRCPVRQSHLAEPPPFMGFC